jgi:hypothetical protein
MGPGWWCERYEGFRSQGPTSIRMRSIRQSPCAYYGGPPPTHLLCVTVISGDGDLVSGFHTSVVDGLNGSIGSGDGLDGGIEITGMSDHIGRSKVAHDKLVLARLDRLGDRVGYSLCVHLGLLVVSGHLGRRDHDSFFTGELLLDTSIEEEGDVGVLFGL